MDINCSKKKIYHGLKCVQNVIQEKIMFHTTRYSSEQEMHYKYLRQARSICTTLYCKLAKIRYHIEGLHYLVLGEVFKYISSIFFLIFLFLLFKVET